MKQCYLLIAIIFLSSCGSNEKDDLYSKEIEADSTIELLTSFPEPDSASLYENIDFSTKTEVDLENWLDSTKYIGINDFGYRVFDELYTCEKSEEIANDFESDSRKALYAYYKLTFGECRISSEEAVSWIQKFESSKDTFGVWMSPWQLGERTLAEEAADDIWENKLFPFNEEQYEYVTRIRNL